MARRIDFYDDSDAPASNSLVSSVNVVVTNEAGEIQIIRRSDNDNRVYRALLSAVTGKVRRVGCAVGSSWWGCE
jgi:hypothetical protein